MLIVAFGLCGLAHGETATRIEGIDLVWHWQRADGAAGAHLADTAVNPASVVKLATTLWALGLAR